MRPVDDSYDIALCERLFVTPESELLDRRPFRTRREASPAVFEFIEGWYKPWRLRSALGYQSPNHFERRNHHPLTPSHLLDCPPKRGNSNETVLQFAKQSARREG